MSLAAAQASPAWKRPSMPVTKPASNAPPRASHRASSSSMPEWLPNLSPWICTRPSPLWAKSRDSPAWRTCSALSSHGFASGNNGAPSSAFFLPSAHLAVDHGHLAHVAVFGGEFGGLEHVLLGFLCFTQRLVIEPEIQVRVAALHIERGFRGVLFGGFRRLQHRFLRTFACEQRMDLLHGNP